MFNRELFEKYKNEIAALGGAVTSLPFWYPFYARSLFERCQILKSKTPSNLAHTNFFAQKRNYYHGISANMALLPLFPYSQWLLTKLLDKLQVMHERHPTLTEKIVAAFLTGASTVLVANPYETTLIAAQKNKVSPAKAFLRILREHGAKGFYTGALPMALKTGTFVSGIYVTSPELQKLLNIYLPGQTFANRMAISATAAAVPAILFTLASVPHELAAVMRQSDPSQKLFNSSFSALKAAYKKHGMRAMRAGLLMRLLASTIELTINTFSFNVIQEAANSRPRPR